MLWLASFTGLLVVVEVVGCDTLGSDDEPFDYRIRVKFTHIQEQDRNTLIHHITKRQSQDLKMLREAREEDES